MKETKIYVVKRGPADMFRGDWFDQDEVAESCESAIAKAAARSLKEYFEMGNSWEQYGYEWSVFEKENGVEKKIWSGWTYIWHNMPKKGEIPDFSLGNV